MAPLMGRNRLAGKLEYFERADNPVLVIDTDSAGRFGIDLSQPLVQIIHAARGRKRGHPRPNLMRCRRTGENPAAQHADIQPATSDDERDTPA